MKVFSFSFNKILFLSFQPTRLVRNSFCKLSTVLFNSFSSCIIFCISFFESFIHWDPGDMLDFDIITCACRSCSSRSTLTIASEKSFTVLGIVFLSGDDEDHSWIQVGFKCFVKISPGCHWLHKAVWCLSTRNDTPLSIGTLTANIVTVSSSHPPYIGGDKVKHC